MKKTLFTLLICIPLLAFTATAPSAVPKELRVVRVTPEGEDVTAANQIVIEFNRPVVPLGRMERSAKEIPITISPKLNCEWRWINNSALACELGTDSAMKPATQYHITISPGIKAEDGATTAKEEIHHFITKRPDVEYSWVELWQSPGKPEIRLVTNMPVTQASLQRHLSLKSGNSQLKVTVHPDLTPAQEDEPTAASNDGRRWLVEPNDALALDTSYALWLEAGLISPLGNAPSAKQNEILQFHTFPEFKFIGIECYTNNNKRVLITPEIPQSPQRLCNPLAQISLVFNAPVQRAAVEKNVEFIPALPGNPKDLWESNESSESIEKNSPEVSGNHNKDRTYNVWLPAIKATRQYTVTIKARDNSRTSRVMHWFKSLYSRDAITDLQDYFGRKILDPVTIKFTTDHRKPNFEMPYHDAILEKQIDSEVPVYVNNLKSIAFNYRTVTQHDSQESQSIHQKLPKVDDVQYAIPLGVRAMLHGNSGAIFGALTTDPNLDRYVGDYRLFAEVTPFQLQLKLGQFNSLVWVTDLATGEAVANAKVTVYKDAFTTLSQPHDIVATATTDRSGIAILPGTETIDPNLNFSRRWQDTEERFFIRIDHDQDLAILPISDQYSMSISEPYEEDYEYKKQKYGHLIAWGITAQGIYRVGDTIQYKIYVRNQDNRTLVAPPSEKYTLQVIDPAANVIYEAKDISLSPFGAYSGEITLSKQAAVGWYDFRLIENSQKVQLTPMQVLVSDFTPAPFKVSNELNGDLFTADQAVTVTTHAKLHSGGPYGNATARITAVLANTAFISKNPIAEGFTFSTYTDQYEKREIYQKIAALNAQGELITHFTIPKQTILYGHLNVESAVQDERGKYIASQAKADYVGVDRFVGLKLTQWIYTAGVAGTLQYLVVDQRGNPVAGTPVDIEIQQKITTAARIKDAGNAYTTHYTTTWQTLQKCNGTATTLPLTCEFTPKTAGDYRATAHLKDTKGNEDTTEIPLWVAGKEFVLWEQPNENYLQILPEKTDYHVGDTARFLIKNPYPGAKALITIERYGVIDSFVQTFKDSTQKIEFPIKADYLPGFYVSVTVVSPRVAKPLGEGQVDLGKPTFRMGYLKIPVSDPYKQLLVTAKTDHDKYRPRDTVIANVHAEPRNSVAHPEPIEFTVAVIDESVFDLLLAGKAYYDPYHGFYKLDNLDVNNYSLLTRLVGRQKFEKKGANPGGDGGVDLGVRNFFKFISYWNPTLKADANGNASFSFKAPDNLTGWRVLVLAVTPGDRMGLGDVNFKVNRPTEIRPVMPNQVTEGDQFKAGFSVMNRTDKTRSLEVNISATGDLDSSTQPMVYQQTLQLAPYQRSVVYLPLHASHLKESRDLTAGTIHFVARAGDALDKDAMEYSIPVEKMRTLDVAANYGTTESEHVSQSIAIPDHINTDLGNISVVVAPSVIANVEGAFRYMKYYPYLCWEQMITKGVMAAHYQKLQSYIPKTFSWKDAKTLPSSTLNLAANFQAPNGGMAFYTATDDYSDPYLSAYTALAFDWLQRDGYPIPQTVNTNLQNYLLNFLRHDAVSEYYSEGMSATVRAVALNALAQAGKITKDDLQRYRPYVPKMSLFGKAMFVAAATRLGEESLALDVSKMILAQSNQTGGKFVFSETLDDGYSRILASPLRENCAILQSFTALAQTSAGKTLLGDVPYKLARMITETRKNRDHWENTQENIFCMQALVDYSRVYENVTPNMQVSASMDQKSFGHTRFTSLTAAPVTFKRALQKNDPGRNAEVSVTRQGQGRLYYATQLSYSPLSGYDHAANAGIEVHREYSVLRNHQWALLKNPISVKRGELVRVDLYVSIPAARNFVVVADPVPGGLEPVNRNLATASEVDADQAKFTAAQGSIWFHFSDWVEYNVIRWSFYHQELRNDAVQFYSDYLPQGNYHLSYTAQAIAAGTFTVMPLHAEEMYDPDVYGKGVMEQLLVTE